MLVSMLMIISATSVLRAAPPPNPTKVGVFNSQGAPSSIEDGLREGLKELGYVEGKNIRIEWRRAASSEKEMPRQAADLARLDLDLIISMGTPATRAALDA